MQSKLGSLATFWLALCLFLPGMASAQASAGAPQASDASRDASARALFEEGLTLGEQGTWELAEDRFRRAYTLRASPVIGYNLASALIERGKLIEASELLRKVEHDDKVDAAMKASARALQADLTPRIGRLTVQVRDKQPTDEIKLDDAALVEAQLGVEVPIDPGAHRIALLRAGEEVAEQNFEIASGQSAQVALDGNVAPTPAEVAAAAEPAPRGTTALPVPPATTPVNESGAVTGKWWFWTSIGVVAAAAIVGSAVAVSSGGTDKTPTPFQGDIAPGSLMVEVAR